MRKFDIHYININIYIYIESTGKQALNSVDMIPLINLRSKLMNFEH